MTVLSLLVNGRLRERVGLQWPTIFSDQWLANDNKWFMSRFWFPRAVLCAVLSPAIQRNSLIKQTVPVPQPDNLWVSGKRHSSRGIGLHVRVLSASLQSCYSRRTQRCNRFDTWPRSTHVSFMHWLCGETAMLGAWPSCVWWQASSYRWWIKIF